ncbi:MAG TPA: efflux RND transporter periplasmic adaptor subunit [Planctomycetota bacterium]|nr:efflux RND transporter periplasmic adaptor subunit [Planctomycetota bacterium]
MSRRTLSIGAVAVLAVAGLVYVMREEDGSAQEWRTATVERGDLVVAVTATGTLQPVTQVQVGTQVTGSIAALYADFNSRVTQGQVVAQIDPAPYKGRVDSDRANLARAKADVLRVQALLKQAEQELQRYSTLVESDLVTQSEYEATLANRDSLLAQVTVAEASVRQQEATLAISEVNLRYTTIESPIDGIVVSRSVDVGQTVSASLSAPTIFVIAADLERMQVQAAVSEADIGRVQVGQMVSFEVDAFMGEEFAGSVSQVRLAPTTVQNVVTYTVLVDASNPGGRLMPGMTADLTFEIERRPDVLLVPDSALRFDPTAAAPGASRDEDGGGGERPAPDVASAADRPDDGHDDRGKPGRVYVLRDGGPGPVDVSLGPSDGVLTAVLSGGLAEGDVVITGRSPSGAGAPGAPSNPFVPTRRPGVGGRGPR